jgi:hypothetical protein
MRNFEEQLIQVFGRIGQVVVFDGIGLDDFVKIVFGGLQKVLDEKGFEEEILLYIKIKLLIAKFLIPACMRMKLAPHIIKPVLNKQVNPPQQILMIGNILVMDQLDQIIDPLIDLLVLFGREFRGVQNGLG